MSRKIAVLGAGAWGTALACVAARAGHEVSIWGRDQSVIDELNNNRRNPKYLGDLQVPKGITASTKLQETAPESDVILLCVPTQTLGNMLEQVKPHVGKAMLVSCCKGIDRESLKLPADLVSEIFPQARNGVLSGPSFASDVVGNLPTAVTVASADEDLSFELAGMLSAGNFRCYASTDIKGVELGGALKNVLALAVGAARGMGLGASAEAALIARGFAEISRIATRLGARSETLSGLSGLGDLVLTCSSTQSRNFTYGAAMGKGEELSGRPLAEGVHTASVALEIARTQNLDVPIVEAVVNVLERRVTAREAVEALLTRPLKREN